MIEEARVAAEKTSGDAPTSPSPSAEVALEPPSGLRRLRNDLRALTARHARPREAGTGLAVVAAGVVAVLLTVTLSDPAVTRLDGPALTDDDGRPRPVTALQWDGPDLLSIGTIGAGVVTWEATTGALVADPVAARASRTVLALPALPSGTTFAERPAVTLRTREPDADEVLESAQEKLALSQFVLLHEARLPVLTFSLDGQGPVPEHAVGDGVVVGAAAVLTDLAEVGPDIPLRRIATDGSEESVDWEFSPPGFGPATAIATANSTGAPLVWVGDGQGDVFNVPTDFFTDSTRFRMPGSLAVFPRVSPTGEVSLPGSSVTSLAVSGDGQHIAAAAEDGRIVLLRDDRGTQRAVQSPDVSLVEAQEVGLAPPDLWVEPVVVPADASNPAGNIPLGFAQDGQTFAWEGRDSGRVMWTEVGGTGPVLTNVWLDSGGPSSLPDGVRFALSPLVANLARLATTEIAGPTLNDMAELFPPAKAPWVDSAVDPATGRAAVWSDDGELIILSSDLWPSGTYRGTFDSIADAAFEPVTGALVILSRDGTAWRITEAGGTIGSPNFLPPDSPENAPPPDALALSFPPDEMTTLVLWSRTATAPAYVRRYDRLTGEPLDDGLDVGFEDAVLPDHSAFLISEINGEELLIRDARTGGTILRALFEGGALQLCPTAYGRELGTVTRDGQIWTLRLGRNGDAAPPEFPAELSVMLSNDRLAVPLAGGVAPGGLWLSANGDTLLVRGRTGGMFAARPAEIPDRDSDLACCIPLRPILPGIVATDAVLLPSGDTALVTGADHMIWRVDLDGGDSAPLIQLAGPVRAMSLSPNASLLAIAADGGPPLVIRLARAVWLSRLPSIGHAPYASPPPMGLRYLPPRGLPRGETADTILLATLPDLRDAEAVRASTVGLAPMAAAILRSGDLYLVVMPITSTDPLEVRRELAQARAISPVTQGAMLQQLNLLCPNLPPPTDAEADDVRECGTGDERPAFIGR